MGGVDILYIYLFMYEMKYFMRKICATFKMRRKRKTLIDLFKED